MSRPRPAIVVSLPGRDVAAIRAEVGEAARAGADLAEVRVDRLGDAPGLAALFPAPLPLIATYRSAAEGGEGTDDPRERQATLRSLAQLPFRWIDLELLRDAEMLDLLPPPERLGRIVSVHGGPASSARWEEWLRRLDEVPAVGKLVVPASVAELTERLLPLLERRAPGELVVHTTGPSGPLLRVLARRFGFPFVYAALPTRAGRPPVETSQVPVDRLRPYLSADPPAPVLAVVGRPIAHSESPALHSRWLAAAGLEGIYVALEPRTEDDFLATLSAARELGLNGLNVTHPYKRAAYEGSQELGPSAKATGVVNTVSIEHGAVRGENTDLAAALRRLEELVREGRWSGEELVVVGTGGAARATLEAARELGARATILGRDQRAAESAATHFGACAGTLGERRGPRLYVHATPVGRAGAGTLAAAVVPRLEPGDFLLDWVYRPAEPHLAELARRAGAGYEDGWKLFVYQAAASFALWWGRPPPAGAFASALEEGPCEA